MAGLSMCAPVLGALLLAGMLSTAQAADTISANAAGGYGRLLITLDPVAKAEAALNGAVLTLRFDRKVGFDASSIAAQLPAYIASGRMDGDGQTFRFALTRSFRLHTSMAANRTAVDLLPESFSGTPPALVKPVIAAAKPVDPKTLPPIKVRAGVYAQYSRLVFDWPKHTAYSIFPGKGHLTIRFQGLAQPDFSPVERLAPPWVKPAGWRIDGQTLVVELAIDPGSRHKSFTDGNRIALDILAPQTDASVAAAKPAGVSADQAKIIADAATALTPKAPSDSNAKPAPNTAQTPPPNSVTPPAPESATAARTETGAIVTIPHASGHMVAAFVRGMTAWLIVDTALTIDPVRLKAELGDLPETVDVASGDNATILRIGLKTQSQIAVREDGVDLKLLLAPANSVAPIGIGFARDVEENGVSSLVTLLPGANRVLTLSDPTVGDTVIAVLGRAGRAVLAERDYADFAVLPTAAGIAVKPLSDGLIVTAHDARVRIARPGGLHLTPPAATSQTLALLGDINDNASFLDFARWPKAEGADFLSMERALRTRLAKADAANTNRERLALARFYLANGFAAETLGVLAQMQAADPALEGNRQLQVMRAVADFLMGRYRATHNDLIGASFAGDRHAAFWRGLADAGSENWTDARQALLDAGPVIKRYPADWQARAQLAITNAALAAGNVEQADLALAKVPKALPKTLMLERELAHARLLGMEERYKTAAPIFAALARSGDDRIAAHAIYENTLAALSARAMSRSTAIETLENLRFRWRGDALEMKTLRKLGALYAQAGRWRDSFEKLRIAALYFPNDDLARQAQDDMRNAFEHLFLKGQADTLPPIEALALFYDFIDLTPIGPNGDAMIRRMADRLVKVDLLGPAAKLLDYQITKRLDGVARAQVAMRLALVYLMDNKPEKALQTLRETAISGLPDDVNHQRMMLEARALSALRLYEQALDLVVVDGSEDARKLHADIAWDSQQWSLAAQNTEALLGEAWNGDAALAPGQRQEVMRAAIAYSLANDEASLERLRSRFAPKMHGTPDASAFAVVTQNIDRQGTAFRETAAKVASIGTLEAFMKDFRTKQKL